ncbi:type I-G CRISPR-associated protein Csb2 [Kineosporia babensis]|uniref:Type I-U CRISPR-associated protein Csb2 n=1 Tax=Kineosporia babensis TaxID=499548 RepID=A0A9X1NM62_9ACTN|nr:type I-U CRISPR-associated protein Csb2 [Kineosporia babensis]MCD5316905.1 type I-U CRISPR-associated protein Csb2 [Kineosporia babensis]
MPLTLTIDLLTGTYEAAQVEDPAHPEWPPHPARVFCALVDAARSSADDEALTWLEQQLEPLIIATERAQGFSRTGYVVTNKVVTKGGSQTHLGRTNGLRTRAGAVPESPRVRMVWGNDCPPHVAQSIDDMARRVPYLGRSSGIALLGAQAETKEPLVSAGESVFSRCDLIDCDQMVRVPYPGFLDELRESHDFGRSSWETARYSGYRWRRPAVVPPTSHPVRPSVYSDIVILGFSGSAPDGRLAVRYTQALRSAVLRNCRGEAPEALHGHEADGTHSRSGRPHVAFLALPDVGHQYADGHLLGLAVAVPDLPEPERRQILAAVLGLRQNDRGLIQLKVRDLGSVDLLHQPGLVHPWGGTPEKWRQGSRRWITATPFVYDYEPRRPRDLARIRRSVRMMGLPEPAEVIFSRDPLQRGAVRLRPQDLPRRSLGRSYGHVELRFEEVVAGPLLLGAGRYLGVGLFAPAPENVDKDAGHGVSPSMVTSA